MNSNEKLELINNYIHTKIPLTDHMGVTLTSLDESGLISIAPLKGNHNDKNIAFAGSMQTILTISAWSWVFSYFVELDSGVKLFIRRCNFEFNAPVKGKLKVKVENPGTATVDDFIAAYKTDKKARIQVHAFIEEDGVKACGFDGVFVGVNKSMLK